MKNIKQDEWRKLVAEDKDAVIIDVRTREEFESGYLETAQLIDIMQPQTFMDAVSKLPKDKNYYMYCRSGNRSGQACQILDARGFENTYNLEGGMLEWNGEIKQ
ncbi:rhodanese-like domain-containing protein [Gillisia limnaea]|uniref:Rhodanese-like protein n=1 Tax=Gillisia limnaea (strain DSM 15749 / LMG 21470 / R-8282) TaxID=865937 RepID=H2BVM2_GILLR|nr:rhodanese-like domain-containing protein [Gillisia limnaea]EHQ03978.1 Rhodanese-like protein [Gillisia limnaea DSM 15749]